MGDRIRNLCKRCLVAEGAAACADADTLREICTLMDKVSCEDLSLWPEDAVFCDPAVITTITITSCPMFELVVFCLPAHSHIPLHDHPHMSVFSKIVAGSLHMSSYDFINPPLAEELDGVKMFGRDEPFDTIFFSYCLSMVPTWAGALEAAFANLKTGGELLIVDFWDQADLPSFFARGLKKWLACFHVHYRPELHEAISAMTEQKGCRVTFKSIHRRYAYLATVKKT